MIEQFLAALAEAGLTPTPDELRDALWLAPHLTADEPRPGHSPRSEPRAPPDPLRPPAVPATDSPTRGGRSQSRSTELYAAGSGSSGTLRASSARSPAVPALRHKAGFVRALRPLKRRTPSATAFVVDEDATAAQVATEDLWLPVLRPAPERWLDLALVIDTAPSMMLWKRTVTEFQRLAEQLGAFRHIRVFRLDGSGAAPPALVPDPADTPNPSTEAVHAAGSAELAPAPLVDPSPSRRQAIIVVTDGIGQSWRDGRVQPLLRLWARQGPVAVVTVLPRRMWAGTGLHTTGGQARAPRPGAANSEWVLRVPSADVADVPIPVLGLSPRWLAPWAQLVAGAGGWRGTALLAKSAPAAGRPGRDGTAESARDVVREFRAAASPTAFRLACYLSAAWLNLPAMRLVQHVMLPDSDVAHLAEVFLGGLLYRVDDDLGADPDTVQYEFLPGVRDELNGYLMRDELLTVLHRSSEFVAQRFGQPFDFAALLADPDGAELPAIVGDGGGRPLAYVAADVLAKLGGRYGVLAERLRSNTIPASPANDVLPASGSGQKAVPEPVAEQGHSGVGGYFLGVGVERYEDARFHPLGTPVHDVRMLAELLGPSYETELLLNPTRQQVVESLHALAGRVPEGTSLVLFWSGHMNLDDDGTLRLLPRDCDFSISTHAVALSTVAEACARCNASQVLIVLDGSYAGAGAGPALSTLVGAPRAPRWAGVLASTGPRSLAMDGAFGELLRQILTGWPPTHESLTGQELCEAIARSTMPGTGQQAMFWSAGVPTSMFSNPRFEDRARVTRRVIISYLYEDRRHVESLARLLTGAGIDVAPDVGPYRGDDDWLSVFTSQLERSDTVLVAVSAEGASRDVMRHEVSIVRNRHPLAVIPVVLPGGSIENLPEWLSDREAFILDEISEAAVQGLVRVLVETPSHGPATHPSADSHDAVDPGQRSADFHPESLAGDPAKRLDSSSRRPSSPRRLKNTLTVRDANPRRLGVHPAFSAPGVSDDSLPTYVGREFDATLHTKIADAAKRGGFVLLVGGSYAGKTRSAYEAIRTVLPEWRLVHPAGPAEVVTLAEQPPTRTVVWLDEIQRYLDGDRGLTGGVVRALLDAPHPVVIVGTLWPDRYASHTTIPPSEGEDIHARERGVLALADVVRVASDFTPAEQDRARQAAVGDRRLQAALAVPGYELKQTLAAAPQLVARWEDAKVADPYAWAVLTASLDATLLGVQSPLSTDLLRQAAVGYCTARQCAEAPADWFEQAMVHVTRKGIDAISTLLPVGTRFDRVAGYRPADYLVQHAARVRRAEPIPASTWDALLTHIHDPEDAARLADSASDRGLYPHAITFYTRAADNGDTRAAERLDDLLIESGLASSAADATTLHTGGGSPGQDLPRPSTSQRRHPQPEWSQAENTYLFFTSYADNIGYRDLLTTFHTDLANELALKAGRAMGRNGFLAFRAIPLGSRWEAELRDVACTAKVMIALLSDDYFRSPWCGWEWAVFAERARRATASSDGRSLNPILPVTWVPLRAPVPAVASALQLTSATLGAAYAGSCIVDLMRHHPFDYQNVVIALAEEVLRAASTALPALDLHAAEALPQSFGVSAAPTRTPAASTPTTGEPAQVAEADSAASMPSPTVPTPARQLSARLSSQDLAMFVEALERIDALHDPWTRRIWVTEIGEMSGQLPRLTETPYLRSYFISLVRFAFRQPSPGVLDALVAALELVAPDADGVTDVRALVARLRW